ncbi:MAG: hypothetical protein JW702_05070 [Clostridiales bacterium]|nr:hypothetical protein [Clostridiales bacterium]
MKKNYLGLDILRGIGIFTVLWLHSAFYYFDGLYELDFNNPPLVVTIIGLLLMFAGAFAMISGASHGIQYYRKIETKAYSYKHLLKYNTVSGILILIVAYLYFIFTGPGLVDIANKSMNNSILIELIRNNNLQGLNMERLLYVDSLVMIGMNILLIGVVFVAVQRHLSKRDIKASPGIYLVLAIGFFVISVARIPLYNVYMNAVDIGHYGKIISLNWLVNKNNPIMPYLSFGLMGVWLASLLKFETWKQIVKKVIPVASILLFLGVLAYVELPDTMLERSIDLKWFAIMGAQMGLFLLLIMTFLKIYDFKKNEKSNKLNFIGRYFRRFGVAGLTPFFFESVLSAIVFRSIEVIAPDIHFSLTSSLMYGFVLANAWGVFMFFWEKKNYVYGIEYYYTKILRKFGESEKEEKLRGKN